VLNVLKGVNKICDCGCISSALSNVSMSMNVNTGSSVFEYS